MTTHQTRSSKYTPDLAARSWASAHPEAIGVLTVTSLTPAGRGGHRLARKQTTFFVLAGRAVRTTMRHEYVAFPFPNRRTSHNGICPVCGGLFLEPAIAEYRTSTNHIVFACPVCAHHHDLKLADGSLSAGRTGNGLERWTRYGWALDGSYRVWGEYALDIRQEQGNVAAQLATTAIIIGA